MKRTIGLGLSLSLVAACGGTSHVNGFTNDGGGTTIPGGGGNDGGGGGGGTVGDGGKIGGGTNDAGGGGSTSGNDCASGTNLVYVLSESNDIYSFNPAANPMTAANAFTKMSTLQCSVSSKLTPNSMAVDRSGTAWVNYVSGDNSEGSIFKVDIQTGACTATSITLGSDWTRLGMGFSTVSASDTTETLYVAATSSDVGCFPGGGGGGTSAGLGSLDTTTASGGVTTIGPFTNSLAGQSAELTGTGDGRLYGFFVGTPVEVAEITKSSGATPSEITMTGVPCPAAWAFSFWGGDFYMYTSADGITNSTVSHYTSADGGIDTSFVPDVGFVIVGAGVSTCAPVTAPPPQ